MLIYAIVLNFMALFLQSAVHPLLGLLSLVALVLSIIGLFRLGTVAGDYFMLKLFLCLLMMVPLVALIILLVLNMRANRRLRDGGYHVGLLGAVPPRVHTEDMI